MIIISWQVAEQILFQCKFSFNGTYEDDYNKFFWNSLSFYM